MTLSPAEQQFRSTRRNVLALGAVFTLAFVALVGTVRYQSSLESHLREQIEGYHLKAIPLLDHIASQLAVLEIRTRGNGSWPRPAPGRPMESLRGLLVDIRTHIQSASELQALAGLEDFAAPVSRLDRRFARLERSVVDLLDQRKPVVTAGVPLSSVKLAAEQLSMLHGNALRHSLSASHARRVSSLRATTLMAGALAALCTLLLARILVHMRRDLRRAKRVEVELDRSRDRLLHSQKIEALGRLTGGVAHDFNNLLTTILGNAELLRSGLPPDDPARGDAQQIVEAAERAAALTRQLLAFSRQQIGKPQLVDVNALIRELEKFLNDLLGEKVSLSLALDPKLGSVKADRGQLEQTLVNLIVNARDAMPQGGVIRLETDCLDIGPESPLRGAELEEGRYVRIRVIDTGCGVDPEVLPSIFDPFFTTKPEGQGTGLGLSTVKGLVTSWRGDVLVQTEPGQGSCFEILLPRHGPRGIQEPPAEAPRLPAGTETILVVEDQPGVRKLTCEFLAQGGYTVLEAADGAEALRLCSRAKAPIHLMLLDVVMPGLSGPDVVERVQWCCPEVRFVYMSGYTDDEVLRQRVRNEEDALVEKPFDRATLLEVVRSTLDAPRGTHKARGSIPGGPTPKSGFA